MLRGHSLSIYARFSGKKRTSMYISGEQGDHYYIQTQHNDLFFPLQSFFSKYWCKCLGPCSFTSVNLKKASIYGQANIVMKKQYTLFWISFAEVFGLLVFGS